MDPDQIDLSAGAKALAVLCFIPVVAFALWSEYFDQSIDQLRIKRPQFEREPELEKVRLASLCIILFQITLFFGSTEIRQAYPTATELSFALSIAMQLWIQTRTEKKLQIGNTKPKKRPYYLLGLFLRAMASWTLGALTYIIAMMASIQGTSWTAEKLHASSQTSLLLLFIGVAIGISLGLTLNFALSPIHLKKMLMTSPLQDNLLLTQLKNCFQMAGLRTPQIEVIELETNQLGTSLLVGFAHAPGPFRQTLFISRISLNLLSHEEIKALVTNQISQIHLKTFQKKFLTSFLLIVGTTILSSLCTLVSQLILFSSAINAALVPSVALLAFYYSFKYLQYKSKKYEFQTDIYAIETLGTSFENWTQALRKLVPVQSTDPRKQDLRHLETEKRIFLVSSYLTEKIKDQNKTQSNHTAEKDSQQLKAG
jgi:hypothetical protein